MSDSATPLQHARLLCPPLFPGVCENSCLLNVWCYLTITTSSSAALFSFCLQFFPESRSFPMTWLFISDDQGSGASASASVLIMNIQDWFPLGLTRLIPLYIYLSFDWHETTAWFQIGKEVRQDCVLSPCLFNLYAEYIMRNAGLDEAQAGIKIAGRNINNLR